MERFGARTRPYGGFKDALFASSGQDLYLSQDAPGFSSTQEANGIKFIYDDEAAKPLVDRFLDVLASSRPPGRFENRYFNPLVFVSTDLEFAPTLELADKEVCLLVRFDPRAAPEADGTPASDVDIRAGGKWVELLRTYRDTPPDDDARNYLGRFIEAFQPQRLEQLIERAVLEGLGTTEAIAFLLFVQVATISMSPLPTLAQQFSGPLLGSPLVRQYIGQFQTILLGKMSERVGSAKQDPLDFLADSAGFVAELERQFGPTLALFPPFSFAASFMLSELPDLITVGSDVIRLAFALRTFKRALAGALITTPNLAKVVQGFLADAEKNEQQLQDLIVGGTFIGGLAFIVGTVCQILYDICNTFITLASYAMQGAAYLYTAAWKKLDQKPTEDMTPASASVVKDWFADFDVRAFLSEDLPALLEKLGTFAQSLIDDFVANAKDYGAMAASFIAEGLSHTLETSLQLLFEPYDPQASVLQRIVYVIRQWYFLGTMIGPIIVDIVLFFVCGPEASIITAAGRLSQVEEVAEAFAFLRRGATAITGLARYRQIVEKLEQFSDLLALFQSMFDKLWDVVEPAVDQVKRLMKLAYDLLPTASKTRNFDEVAKWIDGWYQACATIDLFVGILLLLTGRGDVNADGELVTAT